MEYMATGNKSYTIRISDLKKSASYTLHPKHQLYVQCYTQYDLMTICDFNGNLKCNIYGRNG